jgi:hypothetical protein
VRPFASAVPSGASLSGQAPYSSPSRSIARRMSACGTPRPSSSPTITASATSSTLYPRGSPSETEERM